MIQRRPLITAAGLFAATLICAAIHLRTGSIDLRWSDMWVALTHPHSDEAYALWQVRLPRIVLGWSVGCAVAMTGALMQSLVQNPLVDPGLLGLSQGALVAMILSLVIAPGLSHHILPFVALAGGLSVGAIVILLTRSAERAGMAVLLMGIAIETVLSSVSSVLSLYTPPELSTALAAWMAGSLVMADWARVWSFLPWGLLCIPAVLIYGPATRLFDLGDAVAKSLGEETRRSRPAILFLAILITSASVTAVGPLSFLGVLGPHLAMFLNRASGRPRLVQSALMGGLLVVAGDTLSRIVSHDIALPLGLALTLIGAPLFIITLRLRNLNRRA
ncbi:iron ABC transporter permease [Shimia sp. R10_1]|uniref:FecCD family ABC transporter permease n=1 Tax=Shimia sp. R10_1 TaxID=2821095 RepID=UPI001ADA1641|nr:iron ABC transporter permease [Shimia sp. R10_1]MBO9475691.1 iron ABC transporter permease [Shimia sp. R10_1]